MYDIMLKNMVNLLVDRLCRVKLCFDGYLFLFFRWLIWIFYYFFVVVYIDYVFGCRYVCQGLFGLQIGYNFLVMVDVEFCEGLGNRYYFNGINIYMCGECGYLLYCFGNVFWCECGGIFVGFICFFIVVFEMDVGKFGIVNQIWFNVGYVNCCVV